MSYKEDLTKMIEGIIDGIASIETREFEEIIKHARKFLNILNNEYKFRILTRTLVSLDMRWIVNILNILIIFTSYKSTNFVI